MMLQCDWNNITSLAYQTLIELKLLSFPIPPNKIKCKNTVITSYQQYAEMVGCSVDELTCGKEVDDGLFLDELRPGLKMILYNEEKYDARVKHTLWHEVGHVQLGHKKHGEQEEIEAHFFASQANAPNVLIKAIALRGHKIDIDLLMQTFGLSEESAKKKLDYLSRFPSSHPNDYDSIMLQLFSRWLDEKFPNRVHYDSYFDDLEFEREKWF